MSNYNNLVLHLQNLQKDWEEREIKYQAELRELRDKNEQMKTDLAIVHEYTNLADSNTLETFRDANRMIRNRTRKYENLRRCWHVFDEEKL